MCQDLVALSLTLQIVRKVAQVYKHNWDVRERKLKGRFLILRFSQLWRKRVKRWGGTGERMLKTDATRALAFGAVAMLDNFEEKSVAMLRPFLLENYEKTKARDNVALFYQNITYIQRTFKKTVASDQYKEEILDNYWGKILYRLMT